MHTFAMVFLLPTMLLHVPLALSRVLTGTSTVHKGVIYAVTVGIKETDHIVTLIMVYI